MFHEIATRHEGWERKAAVMNLRWIMDGHGHGYDTDTIFRQGQEDFFC